MRVLGIDTATWTASVGVIDGDRLLAERSLSVAGSHAASIVPLIDAVLSDAGIALREVGLIAVSIGPGSFTGLRISLSVAKGIALATGAAVVGVPTLEAYAHAAPRLAGLICPVLDARKREVYAAAFRWDGEQLVTVRRADVLTPQRLLAVFEPPLTLVGDAVDVYGEQWRDLGGTGVRLLPGSELAARGPIVARLGDRRFQAEGAADLGALEPVYVRRSEAEVRHDAARRSDAEASVQKLTG